MLDININNSFNKKDSLENKQGMIFKDSTLNSQQKYLHTESLSASSVTLSDIKNQNFLIEKKSNSNIVREIIIGVTSAVVSALLIYFVFGIK